MMSDESWLLNPGDIMGGAPYAQYICLSDDDYQLTMADDGWNGWNGNTWSLYKTDIDGMEIHGDLVAQCTLDSGGIDDCFFTIGTPAPPESCEESNQTECENDDTCQWVNNTTIGDCGDFLSPQDCDSSIFCFWGNGGGGSCFGGIYEEDNSYCEDSDYIQGDLNGDTILNILDIIIIVDIILNQESSDLADINGDGIVNILDVIE